jgi:hypothetical protein
MDIYKNRRENLRDLIEKNGGANSLARRLSHANASYLSQMAGPNPTRKITERTAREIEEKLGLAYGDLDKGFDSGYAKVNRQAEITPPVTPLPMSLDGDKLTECINAINEACVEAMEVWNVLGGWFPERLPVVLDMVGAYYVDGLIERLVSIREGLNSKDDDG